MMPFLYFPENKLEYIPAGFVCLLFILGAYLTCRIFIKASRREQQQFEKLEQDLQTNSGAVSDVPVPK